MSDRELGKAYRDRGVTVFYDKRRCIDFAACVRGLPDVFKPGERPWIRVERADASQIADIVRRCPTGALHYEFDDGAAEQPETPTTIEPRVNGPLFIRGDIAIHANGAIRRETRAALCRCGGSANKPFCDGTHKRNGWTSGETADAS